MTGIADRHTARPLGLWASAAPARRAGVLAAAAAGIGVVAVVDFVTGIEVRMFPLYFVPIGFAAWHLGRTGSIPVGIASAGAWLAANALGGLQYSHPLIWAVNTAMQAVSFVLVGGLIALLRERILTERRNAGLDGLTGLLNRRAFYEAAERVSARCRRVGTPVTLAYIDLDHFKAVNDTAGHAAGDQLLRDVARRVLLAVRPSDLVSRLGGDEFAVLLPETGLDDAEAALHRIRVAMTGAFTGDAAPVTGSVGAAWYATPPPEVDAMVIRADAAMYAAKQGGRNRVHLEREPSAG